MHVYQVMEKEDWVYAYILTSEYLQRHACGENQGPGQSRQTNKMGRDHTFE